jgi:hypothetical protein
MDQDLRAYLDGMKAELLGEIRATKAELRSEIQATKAELREEIEAAKTELRSHTEVVETRLLTEFWKWARTADIKIRQNFANNSMVEERLLALEDRLTDLEKRRDTKH